MPGTSRCRSPPRVRDAKAFEEKITKSPGNLDLSEVELHFKAFEKSKLAGLVHVASQHSVLDVLYGGDNCRPTPSWTYQTTPEVGVSDQQHTGRCWIFATLGVLGHIFRSQYGISNQRATFSEGYVAFWDLYEKSRLFLQVAYDTRCTPLDDPSLCDLLKSGISDGGDYIFCLNLLDRYGVVPTEYYPNSSYGSVSTEALVTLVNQVLRDNVITLRSSGDESLITTMLANIFTILCMGFGTPPAPWKKLDWQIDQCETMAQFATELPASPPSVPASSSWPAPRASSPVVESLPQERSPWRASEPRTFPISVPRKPEVPESSPPVSELLTAKLLEEEAVAPPPPSPVESTATAQVQPEPEPEVEVEPQRPPNPETAASDSLLLDTEEDIPSSTRVVSDENAMISGREPELKGLRPPQREVQIPTRDSSPPRCVDISSAGVCKGQGRFARIFEKITPAGCSHPPQVPPEGCGSFFPKIMPESGCLMGRFPKQVCRLSHTMEPQEEEALSFNYTPPDFYRRFLTGVKFVPLVCDPRFPSGTRIISNDANMYGGLPSLYVNVTIDDVQEYAVASLKRNIPVWFACDVKKQLTPEGGRMCTHTDRLSELLPYEHHQATKLQEIRHFNAIANHALLISAVSLKAKKPMAWRVVNSWGDVGRHSGVFVACGDWFREHVYAINAVYDTLKPEHKRDSDLRFARPTVRLGPFDPSVI